MENTLDYSGAPHGFALCSSTVCGKADSCLRHLAFKASSPEEPFLRMVNPYLAEQSTQGCKHFAEARKKRFARGFMKLARVMPVGVATTFRSNLIFAFGRKKFYHIARATFLSRPKIKPASLPRPRDWAFRLRIASTPTKSASTGSAGHLYLRHGLHG